MLNQDKNITLFLKHWSGVAVLGILAGLSIWSMINLGPWLKRIQGTLSARSGIISNSATVGSPEDTFDQYIKSIQQGDIETAVNYFTPETKNHWRNELIASKKQDSLGALQIYTQTMRDSFWRESVTENKAILGYSIDNKKSEVTFKKLGNEWKIEKLSN